MKQHAIALWKTGLMDLIVADGRSKTRSVKVVQKGPLFSKNIDAVRKLIMQDRHVIYRGIEPSFLPPTYIGYYIDIT